MLYYANDLVVSKTGNFYRIIARDPTRSTRQRTLYRLRRLSDGREMKSAYRPFADFWRAPRAAEAALDAGDVAGATRAALEIGYPVDAAAAAAKDADGVDEVEVEAVEVEVEARDDAPPPPAKKLKTPKKSKKPPMSEAIVAGSPLASSRLRARSPPGAPVRPLETSASAAALSKSQRRRRGHQSALPAWMQACPEGCVWEGVVGHAPSEEAEPWPADSQGEGRPLGDFVH
jgi:hypothetical protein